MSEDSGSRVKSFLKKGMTFKNKRFGEKVYITNVKIENDTAFVEFQVGFEIETLPEKVFLRNYIRVIR
jgi:hypothetical protein